MVEQGRAWGTPPESGHPSRGGSPAPASPVGQWESVFRQEPRRPVCVPEKRTATSHLLRVDRHSLHKEETGAPFCFRRILMAHPGCNAACIFMRKSISLG